MVETPSHPVASEHSVLVVEDDESAAALLSSLLERNGYRVTLVRDGREAMRLCDASPPPSLVLLDLMLPYADGFEVIAHLRAAPGWETVPLVVLTGQSLEDDVVRALEAGADDYVTKPFRHRELIARIERQLDEAP